MWRGGVDAVVGLTKTLVVAGLECAGAGRLLMRGSFVAASALLMRALVRVAVQAPVDFVLMLAGRAISSIQTIVGLEGSGRPLTTDELTEARLVFGDSIAYERVVIKHGNAGVGNWSGNRCFVHGHIIYMKRTSKAEWFAVLIHELVHVWQHEHVGTRYMSEALWSQRLGQGAYEWVHKAQRNVPWHRLGREQQAAVIEDAYRYGFFGSDRCLIDECDMSDYVRSACATLRTPKLSLRAMTTP